MKNIKGFTLIELIVTMAIMAILVSVAIFAMRGAQVSSRDARRKADLEQIRSALELYRSDCRRYPESLGTSLQGGGTPASCTGTYMQTIPQDLGAPNTTYSYVVPSDGSSYKICAALEETPTSTFDTSGCNCGSISCNYSVTSP